MIHEPTYNTHPHTHRGMCQSFAVEACYQVDSIAVSHSGWEFCWVESGSFSMHIRNHTWHLKPGQILFYNANEWHTEIYEGAPRNALAALIVPSSFIASVTDMMGLDPDELVFDAICLETPHPLFDMVKRLYQLRKVPDVSTIVFDCLLTELVVYLLHEQAHSFGQKVTRYTTSGHFPSHFDRAKCLMHEAIFEPDIDLTKMAQMVGLSKYHFVRHFKRYVGVTPMQYLNRLRVDLAKQKLVSSDIPITQLAFELACKDLSTFNKLFKRVTEQTPREYRNASKSAIIS